MAYKLTVDSGPNIGLQPWLMAMSHNTVDIQEARSREVVSGMIVRVDPPFTSDPKVTLVAVDLNGRGIEGGPLRTISIEDITEVAVW